MTHRPRTKRMLNWLVIPILNDVQVNELLKLRQLSLCGFLNWASFIVNNIIMSCIGRLRLHPILREHRQLKRNVLEVSLSGISLAIIGHLGTWFRSIICFSVTMLRVGYTNCLSGCAEIGFAKSDLVWWIHNFVSEISECGSIGIRYGNPIWVYDVSI